jgi:hypothetical protein
VTTAEPHAVVVPRASSRHGLGGLSVASISDPRLAEADGISLESMSHPAKSRPMIQMIRLLLWKPVFDVNLRLIHASFGIG